MRKAVLNVKMTLNTASPAPILKSLFYNQRVSAPASSNAFNTLLCAATTSSSVNVRSGSKYVNEKATDFCQQPFFSFVYVKDFNIFQKFRTCSVNDSCDFTGSCCAIKLKCDITRHRRETWYWRVDKLFC